MPEPSTMLTEIRHNGELYAMILSGRFCEPGVHFFTPNNFSQQLAYMRHPTGKLIAPHVHNPIARQVHYTLEVLVLRKGRLRVDFYDSQRTYLESRVLEAGDTILLATGGHGFEVLEEIEMLEIKQGPFVGEADKTRFTGVAAQEIRLKP
jgi:hypothetical protein